MSSILRRYVPASLKRGTLGFRLMLGYAALFTASMAVIFLVAYVLLVSFMQQKDHDFLQSELHEYAAAYSSGGLDLVKWEVESRSGYGRHTPIMVRVADAENQTLYLHTPAGSDEAVFEWLEQQLPSDPGTWLQRDLFDGDEEEFEIGSERLPEGAILQVGMSVERRSELLESFRRVFAAVALPVFLLGLLGGALLSYRALRPLRHLVSTLHSISRTGEITERVPTPSTRGEFTELVRLFNSMLDRIQTLLFDMRRALDDVAHDLRTPMTRLRGTAELALQDDGNEERLRDALTVSVEASENILTTLNTLMDVAEAEAGTIRLNVERIDVRTLVRDIADLYDFVADEKRITLRTDVPEDIFVRADAGRLQQVIANLVDNAIKYTPPGGQVVIRARQDRGAVSIEVTDTGIGIASDEHARIWERLYRSDRSRSERGLGLGLSLVKAVVEAHGGRVGISSAPGRGSTFAIEMPPDGASRSPVETVI